MADFPAGSPLGPGDGHHGEGPTDGFLRAIYQGQLPRIDLTTEDRARVIDLAERYADFGPVKRIPTGEFRDQERWRQAVTKTNIGACGPGVQGGRS